MKNYYSIILLLSLAALNITRANTIIWTNTAGGGWSEAVNWSPNQVPGSGDTVLVTNDATFTVNMDGVGNAENLVLGTSDLNSTNIQTFQVNSGNQFILNGTVTVTTNGEFDLNHDSVMIGTNAVLFGTINGNGPTLSGTLYITNGSVLNVNPPGMTFNGYFAGIGVVYNYGTVNWNATSAFEDNNGVVYNYGLWLNTTDSTFFGRSSSGNGTFDNYGIFAKTGGIATTAFNGDGTFNNYGTVEVESGEFNPQLGVNNGGIATAAGTVVLFGGNYILSGTNTFAGGGVITNSPILGTNAVIEGLLTCAGETTIGGTVTIDNGAELQLLSTATFDGYIQGNYVPALFTNNGTVAWVSGTLFGDNSPTINNNGLWLAEGDNAFTGRINAGSTTYNNTGEFEKTGTTGTTGIDPNTAFNNLGGTIDTATGTLTIQSGSGNGTIDTASGALLQLTAFNFGGSSTFGGTGPVSGSLDSTTSATFHGTLNFSNALVSGVFTLASDAVMNINAGPGDIDFNGFPYTTFVTNNGTVNWFTGNLFGDNSPTIVNNGTWNLLTNGVFLGHGSSGETAFNNIGTIRKTGVGGTTQLISFIFDNTGLLDAQTGAVSLADGYTLSGGTLNFGLNNPTNFGSVAFSGNVQLTGTVSANLNNLFGPDTTNSFPVVTYGSRGGTFTNFNLPAGFAWTNNYGATVFSLQIASVNPPQVVSAPSVQNGVFSYSFSAVPGQTYQVQTNSNLTSPSWGNDGPSIYVTNSSPIVISNLVTIDPQLFYRLVIQ